MVAKADVQEHLTNRSNVISELFDAWGRTYDSNEASERALLVEDYFRSASLGEARRVGTNSVYVRSSIQNPTNLHIVVVGRHDVNGLRSRAAEIDSETPQGPGLASRLGPTVAFTEGVQAARASVADLPVAVSFLSIGGKDTHAAVAPSLLTGNVDAVFLTNAASWSPQHPTITTGARGQVVAELSLSGTDAVGDYAVSGAIRNPLTTMAQLLGRIRDDRGRIVLDGFYDRAHAPDDGMRAALRAGGHDPNGWTTDLGLAAPKGRLSSLERAALWPGVSVLGISSDPNDGLSTPRTVSATLAIYLVPDQRHAEVELSLRDWFNSNAPADLRPAIKITSSARPFRAPTESLPVAAQIRAATKLFGRQPVLVPAGGAVGAGESAFGLGAPVGFAGLVPPTGSYGSLTEQLSWESLTTGAAMAAETVLQARR